MEHEIHQKHPEETPPPKGNPTGHIPILTALLATGLFMLGEALVLRNLVSLVAPMYFFVVIDRGFAPFEESKLEREIGAPYLAYKSKVRRWLRLKGTCSDPHRRHEGAW